MGDITTNITSTLTEVDNGNSGTTKTLDFSGERLKQKVTLTGNCTFTFSPAPSGANHVTLVLIQDATGSRTVTWPASVKWPDAGTAPTLSTAASSIDIVSFYYSDNDTTYYGVYGADFQTP